MYFIPSLTFLAGGAGLRKSFIWSHKKPPELVCGMGGTLPPYTL
jgi:hypothetical protein